MTHSEAFDKSTKKAKSLFTERIGKILTKL
jgi:hypothetical protein